MCCNLNIRKLLVIAHQKKKKTDQPLNKKDEIGGAEILIF